MARWIAETGFQQVAQRRPAAAESAHAGHRLQAVTLPSADGRSAAPASPPASAGMAGRGHGGCWRSASLAMAVGRDQPLDALPDRCRRVDQPGRAGVHSSARACISTDADGCSSSLPLVLPWLLFPVITQGDQIIDNLSINWMRIISTCCWRRSSACRWPCSCWPSRTRSGRRARRHRAGTRLVPGLAQTARRPRTRGRALFWRRCCSSLEMWVAVRFLGLLMIVTLIVMIWAVLIVRVLAHRRQRRGALADAANVCAGGS